MMRNHLRRSGKTLIPVIVTVIAENREPAESALRPCAVALTIRKLGEQEKKSLRLSSQILSRCHGTITRIKDTASAFLTMASPVLITIMKIMKRMRFTCEKMRNPFTLLLLASFLLCEPAQAATVTTTADNGPGSLREAIANAAPGETINFSIGGAITLTGGGLLIDKDLVISGPGASNLVVQRSTDIGTPNFRIFNVFSGIVSISGLTVSNGRDDVGGGIYSQTPLTLNDCVVTDNVATESGGGIFNSSTMVISNCVVRGNPAAGETWDGFGGGIYNAGTMTTSNSTIDNNSVTSSMGGGYGGGIYNDGTLTLTGSVISGNSAAGGPDNGGGFGGGLNNGFGTAYLDNSTVKGNVARGGAGSAGGLGEGGGVADGFGTVTLDRSTVSGNFAVGGDGGSGGPGEGGGIANDYGTVYVDNSTVSGNVSNGGAGTSGFGSRYGGGIFNDSGSIELTSSTIAFNVVSGGFPQDGGGMFNLWGAVELKNTIIAANNATVDFFNGEFGYVISDGFNLAGSTNGVITPGPGDQFNITAAALKLGPLQDNGGPTFTHALLCGSPALNAGDNTDAPATDQRGFGRIVGGVIDIGAYEGNNTAPSISCPSPITLNCAPPTGQAATVSVNVGDGDGDPLVVVWTVDGTAYQTNVVAAGGPPTLAQVDFTAVFGVGSHQINVSVSDPGECVATCSTTVEVRAGGSASPVAGVCSLGQAGGYAVFIMGNVGGTKSTISSANTKVTGHVAVGPSDSGSSSDLLKATIDGTLFVDPAAIVDIHPDLIVTGGVASQNLTVARNDALAASACFAALAPTRTLSSITSSMIITGNGGLNVINVGSIVLVKKVLTLSGGPNDVFIINVSGDCSFGSAQVVLAGGLKASQVLWNFPGPGTAVNVYKDVTYVSGTFLVPFRDYVQDVAHLNGAVIGGGNVRIHSGATVTYPSECTP